MQNGLESERTPVEDVMLLDDDIRVEKVLTAVAKMPPFVPKARGRPQKDRPTI